MSTLDLLLDLLQGLCGFATLAHGRRAWKMFSCIVAGVLTAGSSSDPANPYP